MLHYKIILLLLSSSVLIHSADNTSTTKSRGRSFFLHANEQESNFSTRKQQSNVWTTLLPTYFFSLLPKEALKKRKKNFICILYWFNQHFLYIFNYSIKDKNKIEIDLYFHQNKFSLNAWFFTKASLPKCQKKLDYSTSNMKNFRGLKNQNMNSKHVSCLLCKRTLSKKKKKILPAFPFFGRSFPYFVLLLPKLSFDLFAINIQHQDLY